MKAMYLLDQTCNIENAPEVYRKAAEPVFQGESIKEWRIPKGTIVEGAEALLRVQTGQAMPIDDECAKACGLTEAQLQRNQRAYLAAAAGIRGKKDFELFMAGVIDGYAEGTTEGKSVYVPGENHQRWLDAKSAAASKEEDI